MSRMRCVTRGFTLLEVLVTVAILGVLAGALVLAVGAGDEEQVLRREAERLQARIGYACERAELTGREIGLHLRAGGYAFSVPQAEGWRFIEDDVALERVDLPTGLMLIAEDRELDASFSVQPQFQCFASGEAIPLSIELGSGPRATRWRIDVAVDGTTSLRHRGPEDRDWIETVAAR